jgi:predicted ABC-type transport system involved in lysophospholipase L1 biosynthesis ATPase subunit
MIRFDRVRGETFGEISFELTANATGKIIFASQEQKNELFGVLTGLRRPRAGEARLLGQNLHALEETERLACFRRIGVVPEDGGLISNLKAWENLVLPVWYHHSQSAREVESDVVKIFGRLGQDEDGLRRWMGQLPDRLTLHEKRSVALARAMLMRPEIMIYDSIFAGLERAAAQRLMDLTREYHAGKEGQVSLYLCADDAMSARLAADYTITLTH